MSDILDRNFLDRNSPVHNNLMKCRIIGEISAFEILVSMLKACSKLTLSHPCHQDVSPPLLSAGRMHPP